MTAGVGLVIEWTCVLSILRPRQNGRHFPDDIFKRISLNENVWITIKISLKFVPKGPINNIPALVQIMAWRRLGDKPLSEPMLVSLLMHICVTRPQWVNTNLKWPLLLYNCIMLWISKKYILWDVNRYTYHICVRNIFYGISHYIESHATNVRYFVMDNGQICTCM